jgi:hypothetical protein
MREIRRRLRELPRQRHKDVLAAVREGRDVRDPRDAALAVDWAETLDAKRQAWVWPWWILPRTRPSGWRAWAWLVHVVWITIAIAVADATLWHSLPGIWRWVIVGVLAYGLVKHADHDPPDAARLLERARGCSQEPPAPRAQLGRRQPQPSSENSLLAILAGNSPVVVRRRGGIIAEFPNWTCTGNVFRLSSGAA